nr:LytR C-terminal domain-containing protein [Actinomycetota bacterium]
TNYSAGPRSRLRGLLVALIALAVVAAIVVVLLLLTGGSSSPTAASSSSSKAANAPSAHPRSHRTAAIKPSSVTVAVLNGTSTNNLAHDVSVKLGAAAYKLGKIATATDQTHTTTLVAYLPGHRAAALIVAKSLGLGAGVVSAADQSSQAVACAQGAACSAQVIVTVGADLNSVASSSTTPAPAAGTGTAAGTSTG